MTYSFAKAVSSADALGPSSESYGVAGVCGAHSGHGACRSCATATDFHFVPPFQAGPARGTLDHADT